MEKLKIKMVTVHLPAIKMTVGYAGLMIGGYEIRAGANQNGSAENATPGHKMIAWRFKCQNCGYKFTAEEPKKLFDAYDRCLMCNSKNFVKKEVAR